MLPVLSRGIENCDVKRFWFHSSPQRETWPACCCWRDALRRHLLSHSNLGVIRKWGSRATARNVSRVLPARISG